MEYCFDSIFVKNGKIFATGWAVSSVTENEIEITVTDEKKEPVDAIVTWAARPDVGLAKRTGGEISGPVPLPTEIEKVTVLRAVHKYKDAREQFERRTHKRLIDIKNPSKETVDALQHLDIPSGVDVNIKL